jgi:hypothetical protein
VNPLPAVPGSPEVAFPDARDRRQERFDVVFDLAYDWASGTIAADVEAAARSAGDRLHRYAA